MITDEDKRLAEQAAEDAVEGAPKPKLSQSGSGSWSCVLIHTDGRQLSSGGDTADEAIRAWYAKYGSRVIGSG